jgi:hypothetical protein
MEKDFRRMPMSKSQVITPESLVNEKNWVDNFNVMGSKNNIKVHNNYRELFGKPIDYDVRGYL